MRAHKQGEAAHLLGNKQVSWQRGGACAMMLMSLLSTAQQRKPQHCVAANQGKIPNLPALTPGAAAADRATSFAECIYDMIHQENFVVFSFCRQIVVPFFMCVYKSARSQHGLVSRLFSR